MIDCNPPRCSRVKDRCQCPNSWVEYISREARIRRDKNLSRLCIKAHAANYKKLKKKGKFKTKKTTRECRDIDTDTLCKWNNSRKSSLMAKTSSLRPLAFPSTIKENDKFFTLQDPSLQEFLGEPRIITGNYKGAPVIIKVEDILDEEDRNNFLYVTKVHMLMTRRIPDSVPRLYKAYFLQYHGKVKGVQIMERLEGVMMDKYLKNRKCDWPSLARALKRLSNDLNVCRVLHSDFQAHNIILSLDQYGRVKDAKALDFEDTYLVKKLPTDNLYILLRDVVDKHSIIPRALVTEIIKVCSLPHDLLDWTYHDFENHAHKTPRIRSFGDLSMLQVLTIT